MEENKSGFLQDDSGNSSTMRAMSWCSFIAAVAVAILIFLKPPADASNGLYIFTVFIVGAFVPKAIQKFAENKVTK